MRLKFYCATQKMTSQEAERQAFELRKDAEAEAVAEAAPEQLEVEDRLQDVHAEGFRKITCPITNPPSPSTPPRDPPHPVPLTPNPQTPKDLAPTHRLHFEH